MGAVEEFQFEYTESLPKKNPWNVPVRDIECILINPKWADHGFSELSQPDSDSEGSQEKKKSSAFQGLKIEDFKKLYIPDAVMKDGILFVWTEKELIGEICRHFENQGFAYVENMVYI